MIRFDDGISSYSLGQHITLDGTGLPEREIRQVFVRWLSTDPWRAQLLAYAARELLVEARTDDALIDRICALRAARGSRLVRVECIGRCDPSASAKAPESTASASEPTLASMASASEDEAEDSVYTIQFRAIDTETGEAIRAMPYRIVLRNGDTVEGKTNDEGHTLCIRTTQPEDVELFWLASISEHIDDADNAPEGC